MIYYGGNDYRDYLAHYGVLGMHWGIRRYQPYSYTEGRDGGSHKGGKEIGIARKLGDGAVSAAKKLGKSIKSDADAYFKARNMMLAERKQKKEEKKRKKEEVRAAKEEARRKEVESVIHPADGNLKLKDIIKTKGKMTSKEYNDVMERYGKQTIIRSGDTKAIMRNRQKLTDKEFADALNRAQNMSKLKDVDAASIERGKKYITSITESTKGIIEAMDKAHTFSKTLSDEKRETNLRKIISSGDPDKTKKNLKSLNKKQLEEAVYFVDKSNWLDKQIEIDKKEQEKKRQGRKRRRNNGGNSDASSDGDSDGS